MLPRRDDERKWVLIQKCKRYAGMPNGVKCPWVSIEDLETVVNFSLSPEVC